MKKYNLGIMGAGIHGKVWMQHFQQGELANILWVNSPAKPRPGRRQRDPAYS